MQGAEPLVRHLRDEVRGTHFLLEFVKHSYLATVSPSARHTWKIAWQCVCEDALFVLLAYPVGGLVRS